MDVRDAVASRYSCRAFLPKPVPEATVREIVERAARAPSGGNLQTWRVYAIAGARLEALKARLAPRMDELPKGEGGEYQIFPTDLKEPYRSRRFAVGEQLYRAIGVVREDRPGRYRQYAKNFQFFGAPVGVFFAIDRTMLPAQWADLGGFIQTVMVLARGYGLDTCPQEAWITWQHTMREFLELPHALMLFCGMALGYADTTAPINSWRSVREPLDSFATFSGFAADAP
jgi:nitroreductase